MITVRDISRNDLAAALAVYVSALESGGLPPGHGAILWQMQDDPTALKQVIHAYRETGEIPAQYRERVQALLAKSAA